MPKYSNLLLGSLVAFLLLLQITQNTAFSKHCNIPLESIKIDQTLSPTSTPTPTSTANQDRTTKIALVGILTTAIKFHRRSLIRATYLTLKPELIDVYFVIGKPENDQTKTMLALEQQKYGDILILDAVENMDDGKTFHYFKHLHTIFKIQAKNKRPYQYVMKTDDDVWVHLLNLKHRFQTLPDNGVYFGRDVLGSGFMAGMGYALSWDLVNWIATDAYPAAHIVGQEDANLSNWLRKSELMKHWISEDHEIYDEPDYGNGWAHPYSNGTLLIHRLKTDEWFIKASGHFLIGK